MDIYKNALIFILKILRTNLLSMKVFKKLQGLEYSGCVGGTRDTLAVWEGLEMSEIQTN